VANANTTAHLKRLVTDREYEKRYAMDKVRQQVGYSKTQHKNGVTNSRICWYVAGSTASE
jgi:hypothetical protein